MADFDLTTTEGLLDAVAAFEKESQRRRPPTIEGSVSGSADHVQLGPASGETVGEFTGTFCVHCSGSRRMRLVARDDRCHRLNPTHIERTRKTLEQLDTERDPLAFAIAIPPPVFSAECLQCRTTLSLVVDAGPPVEVIALGSRGTGLATTHTPTAVAFYLDQAYRARTRGAFTAAAAMYRSALEQLLDDRGFEGRSLVERIESAVAARPHWLRDLDDELMHAMRSLGNRAVHADKADVPAEGVFDRALVRDIEHLFVDVLQEIYELPAQRDARRERFRAVRQR